MGNCLSHNDPWSCFKQIQFVGKTVAQSSKKSPSTKAKKNSDEQNVQISTIIGDLNESTIISAPLKSAIGSVPASGNFVTAVEAPKEIVKLQQINNLVNVSIFTYKELTIATNHFSPDLILGEGGFGLVYKGVIDEKVRPGFKFTKVAVKELNPDGFQGDREWLAEINYLGQFSHPNLVKLVGYCCEDTHRLLVYEYMAYGSLETHLFRRRNILTWPIRMKIALDAAKGLAFLHGAERPIIYRDLKASNILLDGEFNAKLSDFGLAKEGPMGDQTHVSTRIMGTYGYADPEYVKTGHLTAKSDVYGFGVVLLEIMVGKRALDKRRPNPEHYLVDWARPLLIRTTKLLKIIDPKMQGQYSSKAAVKIASLAHRCLSENPKIRPLMKEVVELLETYNQEEMLYQINKTAGALQDDCKETTNDPNPDIIHGKQANGTKNESPEKNIGIRHSTSFIADVNTRTLPESNNYER